MNNYCKITFSLCLLFSSISWAQQNNYWAIQYGGRSALLGGAAIGGFEDNASFYYNPGAVGFLNSASFSINTSSVGWYGYSFTDAFGPGTEVSDLKSFTVPYMISGIIPIKIAQTPKLKLGFTLFHKATSETEFDFSQEMDFDLVERYPGTEDYSASLNSHDVFNDQWFGVTTAYSINDQLSVGLTTFLTISDRLSNYNQNTIVYPDDGTINDLYSTALRSTVTNRMRVYKNNVVFKLGASYKLNSSNIGVTLTALSVGLNIFNYSRIEQMHDMDNIWIQNEEQTTYINSLTLNGAGADLRSNYKTPLSIGLGYHVETGDKGHISFSTEYFNKIDSYTALEFEHPSFTFPQETVLLGKGTSKVVYRRASKALMNVAIGAERRLSSRLSVLGSFRTDFSHFEAPDYSDLKPYEILKTIEIDQDLYHVTLGVMGFVQKVNLDLTFGIDYAYGSNNNEEPIANFVETIESDLERGLFLSGETDFDAQFNSQQLTVMFGFQLGF